MIAFSEILPGRQQAIAIVLAIAVLGIVLELVRKRRLREEYSVVWVVTAVLVLALAVEQRLLRFLMSLFGAQQGNSVLFFCALVFLMLMALQFSVRLSRLTLRNKMLAQRVALLEHEITEIARKQRELSPAAESRSPANEDIVA